jgi:arsenical pump membrane protein
MRGILLHVGKTVQVPILGFVLCMTVVAELGDGIGVFAAMANRVAVLARGSVWRLWELVAVFATLSTTVLSLDATAVLLTPVVPALAAQPGLDQALFAYTANTASLLLPVSNLTNLLALHAVGHRERGSCCSRLSGPCYRRDTCGPAFSGGSGLR